MKLFHLSPRSMANFSFQIGPCTFLFLQSSPPSLLQPPAGWEVRAGHRRRGMPRPPVAPRRPGWPPVASSRLWAPLPPSAGPRKLATPHPQGSASVFPSPASALPREVTPPPLLALQPLHASTRAVPHLKPPLPGAFSLAPRRPDASLHATSPALMES